ncbi:hypothetical protein EYB53_021290 [Candidatus Chloroploca sp. M-50]|uniref:HTH OST-type domain-containing protein n=1 Tax=Candidatus Chloroploca mongolica TaxID=2528176 RepID=A0ABS4DFN4_9CHLR|nr:hypothetical protein [Candidatus Chloroploca mongolica]
MSLSNLVLEIKRRYPDLDPQAYGQNRLALLIRQCTDIFTVEQANTSPSHTIVTLVSKQASVSKESASDQQVSNDDTKKQKQEQKIKGHLRKLLVVAWKQATQQEGWVQMGALGNQIKQLEPAFSPKTYGYKQLTTLLQAHADLFILHQRSPGQYNVRLITQQ